MDAVQLLTRDHKEVKALFREYEGLSENAHQRRAGVVERVFQELEIHTQIEEEIFYPAVQSKGDDEAKDLVRESLEEHHVVDVLMDEMRKLQPDNPEYEAKLKVLRENVEHHAEEEEKELFPQAKKALGDQLQELGSRMETRKEQLQARSR